MSQEIPSRECASGERASCQCVYVYTGKGYGAYAAFFLCAFVFLFLVGSVWEGDTEGNFQNLVFNRMLQKVGMQTPLRPQPSWLPGRHLTRNLAPSWIGSGPFLWCRKSQQFLLRAPHPPCNVQKVCQTPQPQPKVCQNVAKQRSRAALMGTMVVLYALDVGVSELGSHYQRRILTTPRGTGQVGEASSRQELHSALTESQKALRRLDDVSTLSVQMSSRQCLLYEYAGLAM